MEGAPQEIRRLSSADLASLNDLYNSYIVNTHFTFDVEPFSMERRREWLECFTAQGPHQCFVAGAPGKICGYACSNIFRQKAAYATSVETSVYLADDAQRQGLGGRLYNTLFAALKHADAHRAYAGIALPNLASENFHIEMGFVEVGHYHEVGRKFGRYWDVKWFEKVLSGAGRSMVT